MADDASEPIADTAAFRAFSAGSDNAAETPPRSRRLPLAIAAGVLVIAVIVAIVLAL